MTEDMPKLLAEDGVRRQHRQRLGGLFDDTQGTVRIASPYVTDRDLLLGEQGREIRLVTSLRLDDIASGATSLEVLDALVQSGVKCKVWSGGPRLHAKVYVFGTTSALVTSANLTRNALDSNLEVGIEVRDGNVKSLIGWFDALWEKAHPLDAAQLANVRQQCAELCAELRREHLEWKRKSRVELKFSRPSLVTQAPPSDLRELLQDARRLFVCNTNRARSPETATGGYALEEEMHRRCYATAWIPFKSERVMQQVKARSAILMFAKGVGIIGVGRAEAACERLAPHGRDRVGSCCTYKEDAPEWRVRVCWLAWPGEEGAFPYKGQNATFWDVSGGELVKLREDLRRHFGCD